MSKFSTPFLNDFSRQQWASAAARELWEPRIQQVVAQFAAAELEAVERAIRPAAFQNVTPERLPALSKKAVEKGLTVIPLGTQGRPELYAAMTVPIAPGEPWNYRVVVARLEHARDFAAAWGNDDDRVGELLGYPSCCRRYFIETWTAGSYDPTWYAGDHGDGPPEANVLLRWAGVRLVPHMPCSFKCALSVEFGRELAGLMEPRSRAWAEALLNMPMLWSARNSIGEVQTPIFSLNFRSDPAPELREIRRNGRAFPELGSRGVRFPYKTKAAGSMTEHDPREWLDNGFGSLEALERAHRTIAAVRPPSGARTVLDLGCGNGRLARELAGGGGTAIGVEVDAGRARRAVRNLDQAINSDIFSPELELEALDAELVLLMPGRLLEGELEGVPAEARISKVRTAGGELLVYGYADWLDEGLENLCRSAGLEGELEDRKTDIGVEAGVWRFPC